MFTCEYRIFEYAASDLQPHGSVMLIAVRLTSATMHRICAFVASGWQNLVVGDGRVSDTSYIEDFIYDLRQMEFFDRDESQQIFAEFEGLSVGPLRTGHSGSYSYTELSVTTRNVLEGSNGVTSCDPPNFFTLLDGLVSNKAESVNATAAS